MKATTYKCDVCGATRQEANHWYIAFEVPGGVQFYRWADAEPDHETSVHLCGPGCAQKKLQQFTEGK